MIVVIVKIISDVVVDDEFTLSFTIIVIFFHIINDSIR